MIPKWVYARLRRAGKKFAENPVPDFVRVVGGKMWHGFFGSKLVGLLSRCSEVGCGEEFWRFGGLTLCVYACGHVKK